MSYRNGKAFRRFLYISFFHYRGTHFGLTAKRLGVLLSVMTIYLPAQLIIWVGLYLDELFFPGYHGIKIKEPVFIIGNPRSGTTFLQRLLARDTSQFLSMRTWIRVPSSTWILSGLTILVSAIGYLFMRQQGKNKD